MADQCKGTFYFTVRRRSDRSLLFYHKRPIATEYSGDLLGLLVACQVDQAVEWSNKWQGSPALRKHGLLMTSMVTLEPDADDGITLADIMEGVN